MKGVAKPHAFHVVSSDSEFHRAFVKRRIGKLFPRCSAITLSIIQILCAAISLITQLIYLDHGSSGYYFPGVGIYCGIPFAITGGVGLMVAIRPSSCGVTLFLILNVFASIFGAFLVTATSIMLGNGPGRFSAIPKTLLFCGILEFITAIVSFAYCCRIVCCQPSHLVLPDGHGKVEMTNILSQENSYSMENPNATTPSAPLYPPIIVFNPKTRRDESYQE